MSPKPDLIGKVLRIIGIVLMGLTAALNLLGGIGTTCVALDATRWGPRMAALAPVQWLYRLLVVAAIAAAVYAIWATVALARGKAQAYRNALIALVLGLIPATVQTITSQALRGSSAPENVRVYLGGFTLVVLLLFRLPPIWRRIGFTGGGSGGGWATPGGLALFVGGLVALTTPLWAGPTHIGPDGANWVSVLRLPLLAGGALLALAGAGVLWRAGRAKAHRPAEARRVEAVP